MEEQHGFTDYSFPQGGGACFTMCFYSAHIVSCVRDFHISHTLVNHNWTVVTQKKNSKHVCFQFGPRGPVKAEAGSQTTSLSQVYWPQHLQRLQHTLLSSGGVEPAETVLGVLPSNQRLLAVLSGFSELHSLFNPGVFNLSPHATAELPQQLDASLYTALSCQRHESSLGFIVPLLDFLWYVATVLICTRLLIAPQGLIFGSCKWKQAWIICTSIPGLGSARLKPNGF